MRNFFSTLGLLLLGLASLAPTARAQKAGEQQTATVRLSWTTRAALPGRGLDGPPRPVPSFQGAYHGPTDAVGTYSLRVAGTVASGQLQDAVYEAFPAADAKLLAGFTLPDAPTVRLRTGLEVRQPVTYVQVQPARRNPQTGQPERLVSFNYVYQTAATAARPTARPHATVSVLKTGDWFKIGVPRSGVYKLDLATLRSLGLPVTSLDPNKVQLYGNAVGMLPQLNSAPRPEDLVENNVYFSGNTDAKLDDGEFFLFYARGPHVWRPSQQPTAYPQQSFPGVYELLGEDGRFKHLNNIYADTAYYFLTVGSRNGLRIPAAPAPAAAPTGAAITTFLDRRFYEHDLVNLAHSGRRWLGESFTTTATTRDFKFSNEGYPALADLVGGDQLYLTVAVAAASAQSSAFGVALDGVSLGNQTVNGLQAAQIPTAADNSFHTYTAQLPASPNSDPKVTLTFSSYDATATGYLDYLELVVKRRLNLSGPYLEFNSLNDVRGPGTTGTFTLTGASGAQVWDVTNPRRPLARAFSGSSFVAPTDSAREFVAVQPGGSFNAPRLFGKVANQNLHELNLDGKLDLVIVTHPVFRVAAEKLAQHRRDYSGLNVAVVTTAQVYNEFSSGAQDVTAIRDLMKQVYDRNPSPATRRNNLLLLGDASFDYKSSPQNDKSQEPAWWASRAPFKTTADFDKANQNYVPTYESRESFLRAGGGRGNIEGENTYSSEDYYGLLDDTEGDWLEYGISNQPFESTDISIGRIPVRTPSGQFAQATDASAVIDKIIAYDTPASFGKWRNYIALTADDNEGNIYATESENTFVPTISRAEPAYNFHKDYLDLFPQVSEAAGQRSPACVAAIDAALEQGSLMIGYTGHGGPSGLADERIITKESLLRLQNQNRLTFLVTGTCDLSTYDDPDYTSAGEAVLTDNLTAGAVGLFTTTRVVLSLFNTEVVNSFYTQVLARNAAGNLPTLGYAASVAKNSVSTAGDLNNRNYTLLADPTCRLAYPRQRVVLDSVNGHLVQSLTVSRDVLQALGSVRLSGHIENAGVLNSAFSGTTSLTIFDKIDTVRTLGDQGSPSVPVATQATVIYDGQATVRGGRWSTKFVVPKDIAYNVGPGKISLYAQDPTNKVDAQGYQLIPVGGASGTAAADTRPPRVHLFVTDGERAPADTSFVSGGVTIPSPTLLARLRDESGINTSSAGVGHDITATIDNDESKLVVVNSSYTADVDNFQAGTVRYLYKDLAAGPHTVRLKAWDTYNNSTESTLDFIVASNQQLALSHVLNYPNPFSSSTTFHFDHNHPGQPLDVQVQIFTVAGRLVKTLNASFPASSAHVPATLRDETLTWDGRDDYRDQLARGVYVYRVSVRSEGQLASKFEKLVLLN